MIFGDDFDEMSWEFHEMWDLTIGRSPLEKIRGIASTFHTDFWIQLIGVSRLKHHPARKSMKYLFEAPGATALHLQKPVVGFLQHSENPSEN